MGIFLLVHVGLALLSLLMAIKLVVKASLKQKSDRTPDRKIMWEYTSFAAMSGILLAITSGKPIASSCISLFTFVAVIGIADIYGVLRSKQTKNITPSLES